MLETSKASGKANLGHLFFRLGGWDKVSSSSSSSSSAVDQPCLDPQSTCCQELGGVAQVFHRSPQHGG